MIEKIKIHFGHYISLVAILSFGFFLVFLAHPNRELQLIIVFLTTIFYILWGVVHHMINHDLYVKIVVEYILIGMLGLTVVYFIL